MGIAGARRLPRQADEDDHERQGDAVVQAALDVQAIADRLRHPPVDDHGLGQGGVGRGQDRTDQGGLPDVEAGEHDRRQRPAEPDRERQPDGQQSRRERAFPYQPGGVDLERVAEEDEDQRQLEDAVGERDIRDGRDEAEADRPDQQAERDEDDRRRDDRRAQALGNEAVGEVRGGDDGERHGTMMAPAGWRRGSLVSPRIGPGLVSPAGR